MSHLKISTTKALYKPIEVEIDGKMLQAIPITRAVLRKMGELEKRIRAGEAYCAYDQLELIFGTEKAFDDLDLRHVNEIVNHVTTQLFRPERIEKGDKDKEIKKEIAPGDKK